MLECLHTGGSANGHEGAVRIGRLRAQGGRADGGGGVGAAGVAPSVQGVGGVLWSRKRGKPA